MNPIIKQLIAKRQALRLHIEQMQLTNNELKRRARAHQYDCMTFMPSQTAIQKLQSKIERQKQELKFLEEKWKC